MRPGEHRLAILHAELQLDGDSRQAERGGAAARDQVRPLTGPDCSDDQRESAANERSEVLCRAAGRVDEGEVAELSRIRAEQEIDRLRFLSRLGLAKRVDERSWELSQNHEHELRERQVSKDVIKSRAHSQRTIDSGMDRVRERGRERNG